MSDLAGLPPAPAPPGDAMAYVGVRGRPKVALRQAFADVTGLVTRYGAGHGGPPFAGVSPVPPASMNYSRSGQAGVIGELLGAGSVVCTTDPAALPGA
jgi:hypothetical protein